MRESDIRPQDILDRYLDLAQQDAERIFENGALESLHCPACKSSHSRLEFKKLNFSYHRCAGCQSLYLNPRPTLACYEEFYRTAESSKYWSEVFFPKVMEKRRELIFAPRARKIAEILDGTGRTFSSIMEVGAGYGLFLSEMRKLFAPARYIAVEPEGIMAEACRTQGFEVFEDIAENIDPNKIQADLVVCFEVFEHVHSPRKFLETLAGLLKPSGILLFSTLGADGFDLQVLGAKSDALFPPHHINFFSREGFRILCEDVGLIDFSLDTPGKLDVELVRKARRKDPYVLADNPFLLSILEDEGASAAFQKFLSENKLSSHSWIMARKP